MRKRVIKALLLIPATLVLLLSTLALSGCHDGNDDVTMVMLWEHGTEMSYMIIGQVTCRISTVLFMI